METKHRQWSWFEPWRLCHAVEMWHYCFFNTWVWKQDDDYPAWAWEFHHAPFPKQDLTVALSLLNRNTFHYATGKMNACVTAVITIWKRIQPEHGTLLSKEELLLKGVPDTFVLPLRQHLTASVQQRNRQGVHPPNIIALTEKSAFSHSHLVNGVITHLLMLFRQDVQSRPWDLVLMLPSAQH